MALAIISSFMLQSMDEWIILVFFNKFLRRRFMFMLCELFFCRWWINSMACEKSIKLETEIFFTSKIKFLDPFLWFFSWISFFIGYKFMEHSFHWLNQRLTSNSYWYSSSHQFFYVPNYNQCRRSKMLHFKIDSQFSHHLFSMLL